MSLPGPRATMPGSAEPIAVTHVLTIGWRIMVHASVVFLLGFTALALLLPRLQPGPASIMLGLLIAAFTGPLALLVLANPVATRAVRDGDGLTVDVRGSTYFVAWDQLVGIRDRGMLGQVELIAADGTTIRFSHKTEGLIELLMHALEHVAPRAPASFHGSVTGPAVSLLLLFAIPASILWRGGIMTAAWVMAAFGLIGLLTSLRSIRVSATGVELSRRLGRRVVPLRAIAGIGLRLPHRSGQIAMTLVTREGERLALELPGGRILLVFGALDRELRRIHGSGWTTAGGAEAADDGIDIDAVLRDYRERGRSVDAAS